MTAKSKTIAYKIVGEQQISFDIYPPNNIRDAGRKIPAVVFFHGGGFGVGNRLSWFPNWLYKRVVALDCAFISADYTLIPSGGATCHDTLADIKDLFTFLSNAPAFQFSQGIFRIDASRIVAAGTSAGGLCAYWAAMHAAPKPKAILAMYPMGGDFLSAHALFAKDRPFYMGRELLDVEPYRMLLHPTLDEGGSRIVVDSPLAYHGKDHTIPGFPANPRMLLARVYLQLGVYLDYITGEYEPSLTDVLRKEFRSEETPKNRQNRLGALIPKKHWPLFPQFGVTSSWPPTLTIQGEKDTPVPAVETRHFHSLLLEQGVQSELIVMQGQEHSFDLAPDGEERFKDLFKTAEDFLSLHLHST